MQKRILIVLAIFFVQITSTYAHGLITGVTGANGLVGTGFGVDESTPRDCTRRRPCQQDTSIIRARDQSRGRASACGRTLLNGAVNIQSETQKQLALNGGQLPSADENGQIELTIHQINGDGGGPYACAVDATGTGDNFVPMTVIQNVPGRRGNNRQTELTDHPVTIKMAAGTTCTGGPNGNMCLVRCMNPARAGPFGSCVAIQQDRGNTTAPATTNPAAAAPTVTETADPEEEEEED